MIKHEDCFILGAGFSCAYSDAAPGMLGFLKKAVELGSFSPEKLHMGMPETARHYMRESTTGGSHKELAELATNYFGSYEAVNIERLATFLATETSPYRGKEARERAYSDLLLIIADTLKGISAAPRTLEIRDLYADFAKALVSLEIPVISFNYDLLLDQFLFDTKQWRPFDGYGATFSHAKKTEDERSKTALLKLHGSLNWGVRDVSYEDGRTPIELAPVFNETLVPASGVIATDGGCLNINHSWRPYIIPPLANKEGEYGNPLVRLLWHKARDVLASARRIHVLGYSFPVGDFHVDTLFREALYGFESRFDHRTIYVVNRDEDARARAKKFAWNHVQVNADTPEIVTYLESFVAAWKECPTKKARLERRIAGLRAAEHKGSERN